VALSSIREILGANLASIQRRIDAATARRDRIRSAKAPVFADRDGSAADSVQLIAVTKSVSPEVIRILFDLGLRDFGENRPQAIQERAPLLPAECRWHLIGPLQTNKARKTIPLVASVQSVDRRRAAEAISVEGVAISRPVSVLLEVNVSGESTKHGFTPDELRGTLPALAALPGLSVRGLMTMAPYSDDPETARPVFAQLRQLRDELAEAHPTVSLRELSMGMSGDFEVGIEEGATCVRVGSALFEGLT
jgi:hypothetical protein